MVARRRRVERADVRGPVRVPERRAQEPAALLDLARARQKYQDRRLEAPLGGVGALDGLGRRGDVVGAPGRLREEDVDGVLAAVDDGPVLLSKSGPDLSWP